MFLSDKYIAGFFDADGSLCINTKRTPLGVEYSQLRMEFTQKESNGGVLELISQRFRGGYLTKRSREREGTTTHSQELVYTGQRAVDTLCRLKPYLVVKRRRVNELLVELEYPERVGTDSMPNYPSRKWLAGYFDGDGSITAVLTSSGSAMVRCSISTGVDAKAGIELVQKAFGGGNWADNSSGKAWKWEVTIDAAKAKQFFHHFAQYLFIKKAQAYFILGCAKMGHFRDGETIVATLKELKTHPHRLNDLTAEVDVSRELALVQDLQTTKGGYYRNTLGLRCRNGDGGETYRLGVCRSCYNIVRNEQYALSRSKRKSELGSLPV